jgi:hypothetical protein
MEEENMAQLRLRTLGQFDASLDGKLVQGFEEHC